MSPIWKRRLRWGSIAVAMAILAAPPLWFYLPRWSPRLAITYSPSLGQVLRGYAVDDELRELFCARIAVLGDQAVPGLLLGLADPDPEIRWRAADALGLCPDPAAVAPLIAALADASMPVRWAAIDTLGKLGDQRAVAPLQAFAAETDPTIRRAVAQALHRLTTPAAAQRKQPTAKADR